MLPATSSSYSSWVDGLMASLATWATGAAKTAVDSLFAAFGQSTEPDFPAIVPVYDRMLAISLLVLGAVVAFGLIEGIFGGQKGLHVNVLTRTVAGVFIACCALGIVQYAGGYAALLATTWSPDLLGLSHQLATYNPQFHLDAHGHYPVGSVLGLFMTALFTVFLALVITLELVVRGALILLVTAFLPLVAILAIWPRMGEALLHIAEFLVGLLLSKFVIATAVYIGYGLILPPLLSQQNQDWILSGVAVLFIAAFSPVVLMNALRFSHGTASAVVREWGNRTVGSTPAAFGLQLSQRLAGRAISSARGALPRGRRQRPSPESD
jgi:hypothetical protein